MSCGISESCIGGDVYIGSDCGKGSMIGAVVEIRARRGRRKGRRKVGGRDGWCRDISRAARVMLLANIVNCGID